MKTAVAPFALASVIACLASASMATNAASPAAEPRADPRLRTVIYAPDQIIPIPVQRGVVTQIVLPEDESITTPPAMGTGSDCKRDTDTWCVVAIGRDVFVKPRTGARKNNMLLVTTRRRHAFEFVVLSDTSSVKPTMRLSVVLPPPPPPPPVQVAAAPLALGAPPLTAKELVMNRMRALPLVRNKEYSVAVGANSDDIVPTMVFDDGTKTYFSFPNNRPLPTIFEKLSDDSEEMVNGVMVDDKLMVDRVSRRFILRLGNSVAAVINEAFDLDGVPPINGTTVPGVQRALRASTTATAAAAAAAPQGVSR